MSIRRISAIVSLPFPVKSCEVLLIEISVSTELHNLSFSSQKLFEILNLYIELNLKKGRVPENIKYLFHKTVMWNNDLILNMFVAFFSMHILQKRKRKKDYAYDKPHSLLLFYLSIVNISVMIWYVTCINLHINFYFYYKFELCYIYFKEFKVRSKASSWVIFFSLSILVVKKSQN